MAGREYTLAEWQAEMSERGRLDCRFVCPRCGESASPAEFKALGGDPQLAPQACIGRLGVSADGQQAGRGCDWAAFGLLDICEVHIVLDGGERVPVFDFAEPVAA